MKKEINWIEKQERNYLHKVLPLETPFSMQVEIIRVCNFKCVYCIHSTDKLSYNPVMSEDLFKKFVEGYNFPQKLKSITFSGLGEPLLNKDIFKMLKMSKKIAEKTILITNGSLLTNNTVDKLIDSEIDIIRVSMQGLNAEEYEKNCGVKIDFEKFLSQLDYLNKNKKNCKVFLKMPDIAIKSDEDLKFLHETFEPLCDEITLQSIFPMQNEVDYSKIKSDYSETMYGENVAKEVKVCPLPFYTMLLMADGKVRPCCSIETKCFEIGDINKNTITEIWNGKQLRTLRVLQLKGEGRKEGRKEGSRSRLSSCQLCNYPKYIDNKYDNIDEFASELLKKYEL